MFLVHTIINSSLIPAATAAKKAFRILSKDSGNCVQEVNAFELIAIPGEMSSPSI